MDPTKLDWLKEYLEFRSDDLDNLKLYSEKDFYKYIQNTGLNYGHFLNLPAGIDIDTYNWPIRERNRVLFAEAFLSATNLICENNKGNLIEEFISFSKLFYHNHFNKSWSVFSFMKPKNEFRDSQKYFNKRVITKAQWNSSFFKAFLNNLITYGDILVLIKLKSKIAKNGVLESELYKLHFNFYKVVLSVLRSNKDFANDVSEYFISENKFFKVRNKFEETINIDDLKIDNDDSFLIRKFLLDSAVISFMAFEDKLDNELLNELSKKLNLDEDELMASILGADLFLIDNWDKLKFLKSKRNYLTLSNEINSNIIEITKKYEKEIAEIISEDEGLKNSILKTRNKHMQIEEKEKLRFALLKVLKKLKPMQLMKLPINYFTFPRLLEVLPENIFPEEFNAKKTKNKPRTRFIDS